MSSRLLLITTLINLSGFVGNSGSLVYNSSCDILLGDIAFIIDWSNFNHSFYLEQMITLQIKKYDVIILKIHMMLNSPQIYKSGLWCSSLQLHIKTLINEW